MRVGRRLGAKAVGVRPMDKLALSLRVTCPICSAPTGERCRVWRTYGGKRLYVTGYRVKHHPERMAVARVNEEGAA